MFKKIKCVQKHQHSYPSLLKEIYDPPEVLYYKGALPKKSDMLLAVVGSRRPSQYGKQIVQDIISEVSAYGIGIVSGLAYGIDALAHKAACESGGKTFAVLGSGIDNASLYPSKHRALAKQITDKGGAVLSEFPSGTPPLKHHFPIRNRIISGMCKATLIVEATERSGTLITARSALEQNREVLTVPGSIYSSTSQGPNRLIKEGATPVTCAQDILSFYAIDVQEKRSSAKPADDYEKAIFSTLSKEPMHVDMIIETTHIPAERITSTLTLMEMKKQVKHLGGKYFILS